MSKVFVAESLGFYESGGMFMPWIALVAVIGLGVTIERSWALWRRSRLDAADVFRRVQLRMLEGDVEGAWRECGRGCSPVAKVMRAGLLAGPERWRAEAAVHQVQMEEAPAITRRITLLPTLASMSMLIGLCGTVFGMIGGFHCAPETAEQRASRIALSIALAISTTGAGLMVAIPLLAARLWLGELRDRLQAEVALYGAKIVSLVVMISAAYPSPPQRASRMV